MPDKEYLDANCANGLRLELMFPSCWNGKDLDSDDHKSHMAYPDLVMGGTCPEGFETQLVSMLYETIWNTYAFKGIEGQFVLANGDPTGYGYHGDFLMGWDESLLQKAVETCTSDSGEIEACPVFELQSEEQGAQCLMEMPTTLDKDDCEGPREGICGNVPVQSGPEYASKLDATPKASGVAETTSAIPSTTSFAPVVPVQSYAPGTKVATDKYGGGVTIARLPAAPAASSAAAQVDSASDSSSDEGGEFYNAPASSMTTPAPVAPAREDNPNIVSTMTYTSNGGVYEVFIEEVDVTVTATGPAETSVSRVKRHAHRRRHGHNNL
ncbi:hypothetical protein LTS18_010865 [Coniosporium uncinatum]|uniref:Uncharacterized protein n=1 Tax=Coniosporium uncinatum TaxID=93489 RepID=A0ACC3DKY4_9PEZI|nr:hypothetical protein LTS18_010865 [Coniosporium uncinatum]